MVHVNRECGASSGCTMYTKKTLPHSGGPLTLLSSVPNVSVNTIRRPVFAWVSVVARFLILSCVIRCLSHPPMTVCFPARARLSAPVGSHQCRPVGLFTPAVVDRAAARRPPRLVIGHLHCLPVWAGSVFLAGKESGRNEPTDQPPPPVGPPLDGADRSDSPEARSEGAVVCMCRYPDRSTVAPTR